MNAGIPDSRARQDQNLSGNSRAPSISVGSRRRAPEPPKAFQGGFVFFFPLWRPRPPPIHLFAEIRGAGPGRRDAAAGCRACAARSGGGPTGPSHTDHTRRGAACQPRGGEDGDGCDRFF